MESSKTMCHVDSHGDTMAEVSDASGHTARRVTPGPGELLVRNIMLFAEMLPGDVKDIMNHYPMGRR